MDIAVDPTSGVPPYEQLRSGIARQAADGFLPAGTRLPPVRTLASDLGLAANTVARAYKELEADGVVETLGRRGTFVIDKEGRIQHVEVGNTAVDPTGAYQVCDLLTKKKPAGEKQ